MKNDKNQQLDYELFNPCDLYSENPTVTFDDWIRVSKIDRNLTSEDVSNYVGLSSVRTILDGLFDTEKESLSDGMKFLMTRGFLPLYNGDYVFTFDGTLLDPVDQEVVWVKFQKPEGVKYDSILEDYGLVEELTEESKEDIEIAEVNLKKEKIKESPIQFIPRIRSEKKDRVIENNRKPKEEKPVGRKEAEKKEPKPSLGRIDLSLIKDTVSDPVLKGKLAAARYKKTDSFAREVKGGIKDGEFTGLIEVLAEGYSRDSLIGLVNGGFLKDELSWFLLENRDNISLLNNQNAAKDMNTEMLKSLWKGWVKGFCIMANTINYPIMGLCEEEERVNLETIEETRGKGINARYSSFVAFDSFAIPCNKAVERMLSFDGPDPFEVVIKAASKLGMSINTSEKSKMITKTFITQLLIGMKKLVKVLYVRQPKSSLWSTVTPEDRVSYERALKNTGIFTITKKVGEKETTTSMNTFTRAFKKAAFERAPKKFEDTKELKTKAKERLTKKLGSEFDEGSFDQGLYARKDISFNETSYKELDMEDDISKQCPTIMKNLKTGGVIYDQTNLAKEVGSLIGMSNGKAMEFAERAKSVRTLKLKGQTTNLKYRTLVKSVANDNTVMNIMIQDVITALKKRAFKTLDDVLDYIESL